MRNMEKRELPLEPPPRGWGLEKELQGPPRAQVIFSRAQCPRLYRQWAWAVSSRPLPTEMMRPMPSVGQPPPVGSGVRACERRGRGTVARQGLRQGPSGDLPSSPFLGMSPVLWVRPAFVGGGGHVWEGVGGCSVTLSVHVPVPAPASLWSGRACDTSGPPARSRSGGWSGCAMDMDQSFA